MTCEPHVMSWRGPPETPSAASQLWTAGGLSHHSGAQLSREPPSAPRSVPAIQHHSPIKRCQLQSMVSSKVCLIALPRLDSLTDIPSLGIPHASDMSCMPRANPCSVWQDDSPLNWSIDARLV